MPTHYRLTVDQLRQALSDLDEIAQRTEDLARLFSAGYGEGDRRAIRAQEAYAAVQRLQWELQRKHSAATKGV